MDFEFKERYDICDLLEIIKILRSENGCPWDKVQTHESIRQDLIEETYEVCEGIDKNSPEILREELGDLLLQVVFHAQIETEQGNFDFADVTNDICQKLVYRHPHVFGDVKAGNEDEALKNWNARKMASKNQTTCSDTLESVPKTFPALMRGEKVCKRIANGVGSNAEIPTNSADVCIEKIKSGLDRLSADKDGKSANFAQNQQIVGDLLLCFCNLNRILKVDAEKALTYSINRAIMEFRAFENEVQSDGGALDRLSDKQANRLADIVFNGF